jgi:hypothetical protein
MGWMAEVQFLTAAIFFSTPQDPEQLWGPPITYPVCTWDSFLGDKVARA